MKMAPTDRISFSGHFRQKSIKCALGPQKAELSTVSTCQGYIGAKSTFSLQLLPELSIPSITYCFAFIIIIIIIITFSFFKEEEKEEED